MYVDESEERRELSVDLDLTSLVKAHDTVACAAG